MNLRYSRIFHVLKHKKRERNTLLPRIAAAAAVAMFGLTALSITAYAYFSRTVISRTGPIQGATFETDISLRIPGQTEEVHPVSRTKHTCVVDLLPNEEYVVTASLAQGNTATTGFLVISIPGSDVSYHTQQLTASGPQGAGQRQAPSPTDTEALTFRISVTTPTRVEIESRWGTSSLHGDPDNPRYVIAGELLLLDPLSNQFPQSSHTPSLQGTSQSQVFPPLTTDTENSSDSTDSHTDSGTDSGANSVNSTDSVDSTDSTSTDSTSTDSVDSTDTADSTDSTDTANSTNSTDSADSASNVDSGTPGEGSGNPSGTTDGQEGTDSTGSSDNVDSTDAEEGKDSAEG